MTDNATATYKAFTGELIQSEVNYLPLSATPDKACANCRWFLDYGDCYIVENAPQRIFPTGYCDRWEADPPPPTDMTEAIVEAVEDMAETIVESMPAMMDMGKETRKPFLQRLRDILPKAPPHDDAFSVFKGTDGHWHWHAVYTNNFQDREDEILMERAHDNYIGRVDMGLVPMPTLEAWHVPGSEHGEADMIFRNGHFVHAVGHFYDDPASQKAISYYRKNASKLKMSHTFITKAADFDGTHYRDYNTIEITTLPPHAAANPYTSFEEFTTMSKDITPEKMTYLKAVLGDDKAAEIVAADERRGKALEELQVKYKDFSETTPPVPAAPDTEQEKALASVYTELVYGVDELLGLVQAQSKALDAKDVAIKALETKFDADTAAWQKELNALRAIVNAPPMRVGQAGSTVVKEGEGLGNALPADNAKLKFWQDAGIPLKEQV